MKASYTELLELAQGETAQTVRLAPFSLALLMSLSGGDAAEIFYWSELTDAEKDAADADLSNAVRELLTPVSGGGEMIPVGLIAPYAGANLPENWLWCDGTVLQRAGYSELWDAIDPAYKSEALEIITLPDMRARVPIGYDNPAWPVGYQGGESQHTLTVTEMPSHDHNRNTGGFAEYYLRHSSGGAQGFATSNAPLMTNQIKTGTTGGGIAHNNMQPFHVVTGYIIKVRT